MADHDLLMHPERWHERALETRALACNAYAPQDRERLLKVARAYDRFAVRALDWKAARAPGRPEAAAKRTLHKESKSG